MSLARTLDEEFRRVSKQDGISMEELVDEVSKLTGYTPRQLYNYRSGKWPLPAPVIPFLCKRFRSRALLHALIAECEATPVAIPDHYDLGRITTQAVRDVMNHYSLLLDAFESGGGIDRDELARLRASSEHVTSTIWMFFEMAAADHDRRHLQKTAE